MTTTTRIIYGLTLRLRAETYVEASRSIGSGADLAGRQQSCQYDLAASRTGELRVCFRSARGRLARLLGLGAPPDIPSWGNVLANREPSLRARHGF